MANFASIPAFFWILCFGNFSFCAVFLHAVACTMHFNRYAGLGAVLAGTVPNPCMISYTVRISICSKKKSSRWIPSRDLFLLTINHPPTPNPSATATTNDRAARGPSPSYQRCCACAGNVFYRNEVGQQCFTVCKDTPIILIETLTEAQC